MKFMVHTCKNSAFSRSIEHDEPPPPPPPGCGTWDASQR